MIVHESTANHTPDQYVYVGAKTYHGARITPRDEISAYKEHRDLHRELRGLDDWTAVGRIRAREIHTRLKEINLPDFRHLTQTGVTRFGVGLNAENAMQERDANNVLVFVYANHLEVWS